MAIIPESQYPGKIAPADPEYPYGKARNITLPGDGTGTPWEAALVNDLFGFQQALLDEAGITPSGDPETATNSQYLTSLRLLSFYRYSPAVSYEQGSYVITAEAVYKSVNDNNQGNDPDVDDGSNWKKTVAGLTNGAGPDQVPTNREISEARFEPSKFQPYTYVCNLFSSTLKPYVAWTHETVFFDSAETLLNVVYSAGEGHLSDDAIVILRKVAILDEKSLEDPAPSSEITVADRTASNFNATCHSAFLAPNGDYVAFVRHNSTVGTDVEQWIYRSTDNGESWAGAVFEDSGGDPINIGSGLSQITGNYSTESGRTLVFAANADTNQAYVFYTDSPSCANGSWTRVTVPIPFSVDGGPPWEGTFCQNPETGRITLLCRRDLTGSNTDSPDSLVYSLSDNDGVTWSDFSVTDTDDARANPAAIVEHKDLGVVEVMWGSRKPNAYDSKGSIYHSVTTYSDLEGGVLGRRLRTITGPATIHFGYPSIAQTSDGRVFFSYYSGNSGQTFIPIFVSNNNKRQRIPRLDSFVVASDSDDTKGFRIFSDGYFETWRQVSHALDSPETVFDLPLKSPDGSVPSKTAATIHGQDTGSAPIRQATGTCWGAIRNGQGVIFTGDTSIATSTRTFLFKATGYLGVTP